LQEKLIHGANTAVAANREMTNRKRSWRWDMSTLDMLKW
jgi:hypothetical protein